MNSAARDYNDSKIASSMAGDTGMRGHSYQVIWIGVARYEDGVYEARAKYQRGSNQVYLEPHHTVTTRGRGSTAEEALKVITDDVLEWECGIPLPERRAALRECLYEAQDHESEEAGGEVEA